jgi:hypothetical protein
MWGFREQRTRPWDCRKPGRRRGASAARERSVGNSDDERRLNAPQRVNLLLSPGSNACSFHPPSGSEQGGGDAMAE